MPLSFVNLAVDRVGADPPAPRLLVWAGAGPAAEAARAAVGDDAVIAVADADALREAVAGGAPGVVVLGEALAGAPWTEILHALRGARGPLDLPVIALVASVAGIPAALSAGASDAVAWPWDRGELGARIAARARNAATFAATLAVERAHAAAWRGEPGAAGDPDNRARAEAEMETLLSAAPLGIAILDRDLHFVRANRAVVEARGHAEGRLNLDHAPKLAAIVRRVIETGVPHLNEDVRWPGRDGGPEKHYLGSYFPIRVDGRVEGLAAFVVDITERVRAEQGRAVLARVAEALWTPLDAATRTDAVAQALVPALGDLCLIFLTEPEGLRMAGLGAADPRWIELMRERALAVPYMNDAPAGVARVVRTGEPELIPEVTDAYLATIARGDVDRRVLEQMRLRSTMSVPLKVQGRVVGALALHRIVQQQRYDAADLAIAEDIAARAGVAIDNARLFEAAARERARAEEANRLKDEFLAVVSHELRTPLTAILGWARMLLTTPMPEGRRANALAVIERNARAQTHLIEDLLDVSRITSGKLRLTMAPVDVGLTLETAIESVRATAEARDLRITTAWGDVGAVLGDVDRVRQIVHNLLANAVKFTPPGGSVRVTAERAGDKAVISVADTGQGIAAEFLPHVFERFRQGESGTTRAHGGLGLGLTIARHLTELHGGTIDAWSEGVGKGATFTVRLPLLPPLADLSAPPPSRGRGVRGALPDLSGLTVLVVDDDADTRAMLASALQMCRAEVQTAAGTAEALSLYRAAAPDVIVSDIGMPGDDGYALARAVRALPTPPRGRVPALALTAYARESDRADALAAGFDVHISKPIEPVELINIVAALSSAR